MVDRVVPIDTTQAPTEQFPPLVVTEIEAIAATVTPAVTVTSEDITDATTVGKAILTAADEAAVKAMIEVPFFNVVDYGCVADGATDNTADYATVVDAVAAAGGGTIYFPPDADAYMGSLIVDENLPIKVLGYGAKLEGPASGTAVTINTGVTGGNGQTVMVEGLTIQGNSDQTTDGVLIKDTSRARIHNCYIWRTDNAVMIQNYTTGDYNCEGTTIRSTLLTNCITGVRFDIVAGSGVSFMETILEDVGINNCDYGLYLPTSSVYDRSCFDACVWVGRPGTSDGVAMYTDADMARVWARLGGEMYGTALGATGIQIGSNASNFPLADISLHFRDSVLWMDVSTYGAAKQSAVWRRGTGHYAAVNWSGNPSENVLGPHAKGAQPFHTYPNFGYSYGSPTDAPMPNGRDGLFFGPGNAQADTTLFRGAAHLLSQGPGDCFTTGYAVTGSRPNAATVGEGAQFFDSTLKRPIWSDGTNWQPAAVVVSVPASKTAAGQPGQIAYETGFLYVCIAVNTWQRVAIADWP